MTALQNKLQEMAPLRAEAEFLRIEHRLDMENVLTPEQKAKLGQLRRVGRNLRERIIDRIKVPRVFRFERKVD